MEIEVVMNAPKRETIIPIGLLLLGRILPFLLKMMLGVHSINNNLKTYSQRINAKTPRTETFRQLPIMNLLALLVDLYGQLNLHGVFLLPIVIKLPGPEIIISEIL
jgi:hypothetical protein